MEFQLFQILKDDAVKVLHSIYQQIWKTQQWSQDWKRPVFIPIPKKGNGKECSNYCTVALISHTGSTVKRSYPMSKVRGSGQEKQPHIQGAVAARAQEGPEELLHVQGQEG